MKCKSQQPQEKRNIEKTVDFWGNTVKEVYGMFRWIRESRQRAEKRGAKRIWWWILLLFGGLLVGGGIVLALLIWLFSNIPGI